MKITLTTENGSIINLEVFSELLCDEFKILCATETGIKKENIMLMNEGKVIELTNNKTLNDTGIKDGDLIIATTKQKNVFNETNSSIPNIDFSNINIPGSSTGTFSNPHPNSSRPHVDLSVLNFLKAHFENNPKEKELFKQKNSSLYQALMKNDVTQFSSLLQAGMEGRISSKDYDMFKLVSEDPLNPKAQEQIAKLIHQKNIDANMETALEHTPESFGIVTMLYINIKVNGHPVQAFVDTGAQATLMSKACAERCNLLRLADKRWAGIAKGVGTQSIIGRIHLTQVAIENVYIACSFSILVDQPMDVLIGLDILRRHQCTIDLRENLLHITSHGISTPFLAESELPACARHPFAVDQVENGQSGDLSAQRLKATASVNEAGIQTLVDMGFSRESATRELLKCNGNVNLAASNLSKFT